MKTTIAIIEPTNNTKETLSIEDININEPSVISIDGSTSNTGLSILRESDGLPIYSIKAKRESQEKPVQYKVYLKRFVYEILKRNKLIQKVFYEEPFISYAVASQNLLMLRTFIEELIVENEPYFNYIKHNEINNMSWKKLFLLPGKVPQGTKLQKEYIRNKLFEKFAYLATYDLSQDEIDSIAMGFTTITKMKNIEHTKKARPFLYNVEFIGADDDDTMLQEFIEIHSLPKHLLANGVAFKTISGKSNFDKTIYELMGSDDKVIIIKFSSKHHGNLAIKYRIGHLAATFPYLYAIVWRKNRK